MTDAMYEVPGARLRELRDKVDDLQVQLAAIILERDALKGALATATAREVALLKRLDRIVVLLEEARGTASCESERRVPRRDTQPTEGGR